LDISRLALFSLQKMGNACFSVWRLATIKRDGVEMRPKRETFHYRLPSMARQRLRSRSLMMLTRTPRFIVINPDTNYLVMIYHKPITNKLGVN